MSSQQSAESLNGAYRELGYRDGPLVEIAEKAMAREVRLLRDHKKTYRKLHEAGEICGPRIGANVL